VKSNVETLVEKTFWGPEKLVKTVVEKWFGGWKPLWKK